MDGWVSRWWVDGWMGERMDEWMVGWMDAWMHGCMDRYMDGEWIIEAEKFHNFMSSSWRTWKAKSIIHPQYTSHRARWMDSVSCSLHGKAHGERLMVPVWM